MVAFKYRPWGGSHGYQVVDARRSSEYAHTLVPPILRKVHEGSLEPRPSSVSFLVSWCNRASIRRACLPAWKLPLLQPPYVVGDGGRTLNLNGSFKRCAYLTDTGRDRAVGRCEHTRYPALVRPSRVPLQLHSLYIHESFCQRSLPLSCHSLLVTERTPGRRR